MGKKEARKRAQQSKQAKHADAAASDAVAMGNDGNGLDDGFLGNGSDGAHEAGDAQQAAWSGAELIEALSQKRYFFRNEKWKKFKFDWILYWNVKLSMN